MPLVVMQVETVAEHCLLSEVAELDMKTLSNSDKGDARRKQIGTNDHPTAICSWR